MNELEDFAIDPTEETIPMEEYVGGEEPSPGKPRWPWLLVIALVLLAIGVFLVVRYSRRGTEPVAAPATPAAPLESEPEAAVEAPDVEVPPLAESDAWLREVATQLSARPELARWLLNDDLIHRFTALVDNLAEGVSPRPHVAFLRPREPFHAEQRRGRVILDPQSYHRYDTLAAVFDSLHVEGTADLYRRVRPLLDEAYRELGYPDRDFEATLVIALRQVLSVPLRGGEIELEPGLTSYTYADPALEGLDDAQKHFLRMGPENLAKIQEKIRAIAKAAGIPLE